MRYYSAFVLLILTVSSLHGQNSTSNAKSLENSIFLIHNFFNSYDYRGNYVSRESLLNSKLDGYVLRLELLKDSSITIKEKNANYTYFSDFLDVTRRVITDDKTKFLFLFIDSDINPILIDRAFTSAGLSESLYHYKSQIKWPGITEMLEAGKRILVFSMTGNNDYFDWLHNTDDHVCILSDSIATPKQESDPRNLNNQLKCLTIYNSIPQLEEQWKDSNISDNVKLPFLEGGLKRIWLNSGRVPNFLIVNNYDPIYFELLSSLRKYEIINGQITHQSELMEIVYWPEMASFSGGRFSFPLSPGEKKNFIPMVLGYKLKPEKVTLEYEPGIKELSFEASPFHITENMELYLRFEGNTDNQINKKQKIRARNLRYVDDPVMGKVARLDSGSMISLPKASEMNLTNHDFTISVWLNIPRFIQNKTDYCIIGTNVDSSPESYLRGLHVLVRNMKPYFGFFRNDLAGKSIIEKNKWHHLVCRFNTRNGEMAIFLNGKPDGSLISLPSFQGTDSLYVGIWGINRNSYMAGQIDELIIWSRALGEKEILSLYNRIADTSNKVSTRNYLPLSFVIIGVLIFLIVIIRIFKIKRSNNREVTGKHDVTNSEYPVEVEKSNLNTILLFGDFLAIDKAGNDVSNQFTPKVKQLFMILLVNSSDEIGGISGNDITKALWKNKKLKNSDHVRRETTRRLRVILEGFDGVNVVLKGDKWQLETTPDFKNDYFECLRLIQNNKLLEKANLFNFLDIVGRGEVFKNESFPWLDEFKGYISNNIIDLLSHLLKKYGSELREERLIAVVDTLFINDPLSELALYYKVKSLIKSNNTRLAMFSYKRFCSVYKESYGEDYHNSFEQILNGEPPLE